MKRVSRWIFSPRIAIVLLLVFAGSMAIATFVENDFGTSTAWQLVYDTWWFELVLVLLGFSFIANIFTYRLWRKEKLSILLFHLAFIIIIIGAGITRYSSYGGIMRIREGNSSNTIISDQNYLVANITKGEKSIRLKKELGFSPLTDNDFELKGRLDEKEIIISYDQFIPDAAPTIIDLPEEKQGTPILQVVIATENGRETIFLRQNEIQKIGQGHQISFDANDSLGISITEINGELTLNTANPLAFFVMATQEAGEVLPNSREKLRLRTLYRAGDFSFVPLSYHPNGQIDLISTSEKPGDNDEIKDDILIVNITVDQVSEVSHLLYRKGFLALKQSLSISGLDIEISYGSVPIHLPFSVKLEDFQLERYPGSESPSSYASEVSVLDGEIHFPYRIYMNNILDYGGFRFYQASYDTDELGTVLAVNHDRLGTLVSYLGYLLMGLGMFWTLFGKHSRFAMINIRLKELRLKKTAALVLLSLSTAFYSSAEELTANRQSFKPIDNTHAELFGRLMVQDLDGRIKPVNTLASEFIRKISRKTTYQLNSPTQQFKLDANQLFLSLHVNPELWKDNPLIRINTDKLGRLTQQLQPHNSLVTFNSLIDANGEYLIRSDVEIANAKKPAERNEYDKEILLVDERFNILYNVFIGNYLKIFPKRDDESKTWYSYTYDFQDFPSEDRQFAQNIIPVYFSHLGDQNWLEAESKLEYIRLYQQVLGEDIIPSKERVEAELWYNRLNINFWLFPILWTLGFLLLLCALIGIFNRKKWLNRVMISLNALLLIVFVGFTLNLVLRWYIAQHAPWSNGYEMIVFVSWVLFLCGLLTYSKSEFALPLAALFSGTLLFVSYLDWLSPEITNLMPVLKSYWLKIHVATIVSSYAPLALSAILGLMALVLMIFKNPARSKEFELRIQELTYINEISMTIGLFLLAVGTFLGGIWANESWGRYWAWDPKETWALISIIIYAAVLHLRFIPKLRSHFVLNTASVIAFSSIVMTSFGVNYYLSGLHSYAAGDPLPIPNFIYFVIALIIIIAMTAYFRVRRYSQTD